MSKKSRPVTRVDMSSWRTPVPRRSVCLHDNLKTHVVTVQPTRPVLFLDNLSLPYADESLTTTPVDPPPSTSGRHVSISGHSDWSANATAPFEIGLRGVTSCVSDVAPPAGAISVSGHSQWSVDDSPSTDTGSGGIASPGSDVTPPHDSAIDDESRDQFGSIITTMTSPPPTAAAARGSVDAASGSGPSAPVYRTTVASETLRRCEPTHFHWTSTSTSASARPRPSLRPAIVDSIIVSSLVSSPQHSALSSRLFLYTHASLC